MAFTALGALQPTQKRAWVKESIRAYRAASFFTKFTGTDSNSIVQQVTELSKTEKGERAMIGLVADLQGGGVVGNNQMLNREEALDGSWQEIIIDQLRNGTKSKGLLEEQKAVFDFRSESRDKLAFWRAKIMDELMILTASGIGYNFNTNGSLRVPVGAQDDLNTLSFAANITAPSSGRHYNFNGTSLVAGDTTTITTGFVPKYGMIVDLRAQAQTSGVKPIRIGGEEFYVYLCHPKHFAALKKDADFRNAVSNTAPRSLDSPIFKGGTITMDGIIIHTSPRVFNTLGGTSGQSSGGKWGSGYTVDGTRSLLLGAQALAMADIWGIAKWNEELQDYGDKWGISIAMMFGLLKPQFKSVFDTNTVQDFGVISLNTYIV